MRVITRHGLGEVTNFPREGIHLSVRLDKPVCGKNNIQLVGEEIFLLSDYAVIRVLNITSAGWFSNLQFWPSLEEANKMLSLFAPPDETTVVLNLEDGTFKVNRQLGLLAQDFLTLYPWVDRWAAERSAFDEDRIKAVRVFRNMKDNTIGSTGIQATALLDVSAKKIISFYLLTELLCGPVLSKDFV